MRLVTTMHQNFKELIPFNDRKNTVIRYIIKGKLDIDYGLHKRTAFNKAKMASSLKPVTVCGLNEDDKIIHTWIIFKKVIKKV